MHLRARAAHAGALLCLVSGASAPRLTIGAAMWAMRGGIPLQGRADQLLLVQEVTRDG